MGFRVPLLAILAGAFAVGAPALGQDDASVLRDYYAGNGLLGRGLYELAVPEYEKFLAAHPGHEKAPAARYGLAVSLFRLGRLQEAEARLEPLTGQSGFEFAAETLVLLGQCRLAGDRAAAAAETFGTLLREYPAHELADDAAALQAEALYTAGRLDQVERPCALLEARWPDSPHRARAELLRGLAEMDRGDAAAAAIRFEALLSAFPAGDHSGRAALLLAQCLHREGDLPRAAARYRAVIESGDQATEADAVYGLAVLDQQLELPDEAAALLDRFLKEYPDHPLAPSARLARGRVHFDRQQYDRAFELFSALAGEESLADDAAWWSAKCDLRRGRAAESARALAEAMRRYPESDLAPQMTYDLAVALSRAGDPEGALRALAGFRGRWDEHELAPDALELTAATLHQQARFAESLEACRAFLAHPSCRGGHELEPAVALLAAENLFLMKDYEAAAGAYRTLAQSAPGPEQAARASYRLGLCLHHLQAFDESRQVLAGVVDGRATAPAYRPALLAAGDGSFQERQWAAAATFLDDYLSFGLDQASADEALLKLGLSRQRLGDSRAALESLDTLVGKLPGSPLRVHAIFERGQILLDLGRNAEAAAAFGQVAAEGSGSPFAGHALHHLGSIARESGDHAAAAASFGRAAAAFAAHDSTGARAEALFQQGQSLVSARRFDEAATVLAQLEREHPATARIGHARALRAIALARLDGRSPDKALSAIVEAEAGYGAELDPSVRAALLYEKAWCLRDLERPGEAAAAYRSMLAESSSGASLTYAMLELAELEVEAERFEEAAELLRPITADPGAAPDIARKATYQLGVCQYRLGRLDAASELLEAWLRDEPDPALAPAAGLLAAQAHYAAGRQERAIALLRGAVEPGAPADVRGPALLRLGECHAALQQWAPSEQAFAAYVAAFPGSDLWYQARFGMGFARENEGKYDEAIACYREVVDRHQGQTAARAQFQIGECTFAQGRHDEAVRELLKVDILYAYPEWSAAALYEAGRCFQEMASPVEARRQFEKVREDHPQSPWARLAGKRIEEMERTTLPGHQE